MRTQHRTGAALGALFIALAGFAAPFPLSGTSGSLAPEAIEAALEEARQNDVDVSLQNAILYKGLMLFQDEEYAEAIPFLEEALRMDPALTAGLEALGWAYIRTERPERGYALWEYFATLMPDHWMPYNLLAQAAVMKQDWNQADAMFRKALEIKPDLYDQRYWFGQNLLRLGKIDEGEQVFRDLIAIEPGRLDIQIDLANVITYQFEYEEATKIWRHINEELPGNPGFMMNQAELELRIGEVKTADRLCREVLEIEDVGTLYPNDATRAMNLRVDIAELQDATAASMERLAEIIDETEDPVQRSHLRLRQANRYRQLQKLDPKRHPHEPLLEMIREAIRDNPLSLEARVLYAEQCVIAKRFYAAQRQAAYVLERFNKDNIRAKDVLFECALVERRFADAEQILLDRYATSDPTSPLRHIGLARVRMARGPNGVGGAGGGSVRIEAFESVLLDGSIFAKGKDYTFFRSGAGSGGGVLVTCRDFSGAGTINASGGNANTGVNDGMGGGGGRVSVWHGIPLGMDHEAAIAQEGRRGIATAAPAGFTGTTAVAGGTGSSSWTPQAQAGTEVFMTAAPSETIIVVR